MVLPTVKMDLLDALIKWHAEHDEADMTEQVAEMWRMLGVDVKGEGFLRRVRRLR